MRQAASASGLAAVLLLPQACGFTDKWVRNTVPELHNTGWLQIEIGSRGRGVDHCNIYRINPEKRTSVRF